MRILGIDPGLKATGYGLIDTGSDCQWKIVEAGTIEPKAKLTIPDKVQTVYKGLITIIDQYQPQIAVLEKLYAHHKFPATAPILAHARGVICLAIADKQLEFQEYSVKRIRKALVGNGNASKEQTRRTVGHVLKINPQQLTLDASDALALALGHSMMMKL